MRIRLRRVGSKHRYLYRVVVTNSKTAPKSGKCVANIGYYHPAEKGKPLQIDTEKAMDWLKKGAQPSSTVKALLKRVGQLEKTL